MTSRVCLVLEILAVVVLVTFFYVDVLRPGMMQSGGDYANLFWPLKALQVDALRHAGAVALWNPYIFMGTPLAATMQHAVFYPVDWLLLRGTVHPMVLNLYVVLHSVLAGVGVWWWMRRAWDCGAAGAILAGACFPCTAWFWGAQEHINQVAAVAWMPWMLGTMVLLVRRRIAVPAFLALYSSLGILQFLAGHPQAAFYTHAVAGLMAVGGAFLVPRGVRLRTGARLLGILFAAGIVIGLACAVQLLPALELSRHSYRQFQHLDPGYALSFSMPPDVLRTFLDPHAFGSFREGLVDERAYNEYGLHVGRLTLLLALLGLAVTLVTHRRRAVFLAALGVLALLAAMGGNLSIERLLTRDFTEFPQPPARVTLMEDVRAADAPPPTDIPRWRTLSLYEALLAVVPPLRGFRVPARTVILLALVLVTLAGFFVDAIPRLVRRAAEIPESGLAFVFHLAMGVLVLACFFELWNASHPEKFRHPQPMEGMLHYAQRDWSTVAGHGNVWSIDDRLFRLTVDDYAILKAERQLETMQALELSTDRQILELRWYRLQENMNVAARFPSIEGYEEGLAPTVRTKDFLFEFNGHLRDYQPDATLLALLGVRGVMAELPVDPQTLPIGAWGNLPGRVEHHNPLHRGAVFARDATEGIDLARLDGPFQRGESFHGQRQRARIDYGNAPRWNEGWPAFTTNVKNPNRVVIQNHDPRWRGDAILVMASYPGWTLADGTPVDWLNAVHAAIPAEAFDDNGIAEIHYRPQSYRKGLLLTMIGLCVLGLLIAQVLPARRR